MALAALARHWTDILRAQSLSRHHESTLPGREMGHVLASLASPTGSSDALRMAFTHDSIASTFCMGRSVVSVPRCLGEKSSRQS